jgi:hypothetical protein
MVVLWHAKVFTGSADNCTRMVSIAQPVILHNRHYASLGWIGRRASSSASLSTGAQLR